MYKLLLLLINLFIVLSVSATELETSYSGFATYTLVEQQSWHKDVGLVAINGVAQYGDFALKGQVASTENPVRRLAVEYTLATPKDTLVLQAGRVPRLTTLYSDVFGNPDEWGMAVLPLSVYNRRKVHSTTFNALDGVKALWDHNYSKGNLRLSADFGTAAVENYADLQMELTRKSYNPGWTLKEKRFADWTFGEELTIGNWTLLASQSRFGYTTQLNDATDATSKAFTSKYNFIDYYFNRYGIKYAAKDWSVQAEHGDSRVYANNQINSIARDGYVSGNYYYNDNIALFGGYGVGYKRGNTYTARDRFAGIAYRSGKWTTTFEYHNGENSWQRHDSNNFIWDSYVASVTYRF